jgi:hypothetical protein
MVTGATMLELMHQNGALCRAVEIKDPSRKDNVRPHHAGEGRADVFT